MFDDLLDRARADPRHIVLAEGTDDRIVAGAVKAARDGVAQITLLGDLRGVYEKLSTHNTRNLPIEIIDPIRSKNLDCFAQDFQKLRRHKGITLETARETASRPLEFSAMMLSSGHVEGSVAGTQYSTSDTVRAALQIVGPSKRYSLVSSFFIMMMNEPFHDIKGTLIFADCGMVVEPNASELAQITLASADSASEILGLDPVVAMLSFSTHGSASHPLVDKVVEATRQVKEQRPELVVEGELQLDAALIPEVNAQKAPNSVVGGNANILIFPNLEAGNIGYKLAERIGKAHAVGPVIQGLAKPANDLSRGCCAEDVYNMIAVTVIQAHSKTNGCGRRSN